MNARPEPVERADFTTWAAAVRRLDEGLTALAPAAATIGVPPPADRPWFDLLEHKLRPQTREAAPLVAAVVGGTNIGKSALFNQLAGTDASAVSPLAAGTKHPVCLAPPAWADAARLAPLFEGFELQPWGAAADALADDQRHLLFWRSSSDLPDRLLLLDTPDVDSDARVNWRRAEIVRQTADVLVAVLTQQKYNDAAVKQFFREAAEADKAVIVVFNQVDLALDREVWSQWSAVFREQTGVRPIASYVVPYDRQAAQSRGLKFYSVGPEATEFQQEPVDLGRELTELRYDDLKTRTLRGALARVLEPGGVERYLAEVRIAADRFSAARKALAEAHRVTTAWPGLPAGVLVEEIGAWWDARRSGWSRSIHGFYRTVGRGLTIPIKRLWSGPSASLDPLAQYRERERAVITAGIDRLLDELERLATVGNDVLEPRLRTLVGGAARQSHLRRIQEAYEKLPPVDDEFRAYIGLELERLEKEYPRAIGTMRSLDAAAAIARPAITVTLATTGILLPAGDILGQALVNVAGHTASEIAAAAVVTGGGEAAMGAAGTGLKHGAAKLFSRLQSQHAARRAAQLTEIFERELLGDLLIELDGGARLGTGPETARVQAAVDELRRLM
jgi:hypothetical protein